MNFFVRGEGDEQKLMEGRWVRLGASRERKGGGGGGGGGGEGGGAGPAAVHCPAVNTMSGKVQDEQQPNFTIKLSWGSSGKRERERKRCGK